MRNRAVFHRLASALLLSLPAVSLVAFASEPRETTDVEVTVAGRTERVSLVDLKPGETRQLYSQAGTRVTATRTAESLELDIGGDRTSIRIPAAGGLDEEDVAALIEGSKAADTDARRVIRIRHASADAVGQPSGASGKRVMIVHGDGELQTLEDDDLDVLLQKVEGDAASTDGKRVIVRRSIDVTGDTPR